ncbi:MAG: NAD(P)/FAD-dependent oxidoreductase [Betaproteobacteria bacterium]|nr:NAD(P)/FAD-dependent oxidoreductase [Betaproteobacteria bacterium]
MSEIVRARVIIVGAGPAGLTAAYELAQAGVKDIVVLEATRSVGGLAQSVEFNGNRIDIGGHRFFSKSDWVMDWWLRMLPLAAPRARDAGEGALRIDYQGKWRELYQGATASESERDVMLVRNRLSRIYFDGKFFDYPLKANFETALKLGLARCVAFGASYAWSKLFPRRPERSLEDFFINRFGRRLYLRFFKEYTEKVWGTSCDRISAEWGAQRVKSLSIGKALLHALRKPFRRGSGLGGAAQTSLIERFLYPKLGPGQMWEVTAGRLGEMGVRLINESRVKRIDWGAGRVAAVHASERDGVDRRYEADFFISSMPVRDLVLGMEPPAPQPVREIAAGLQYRDFVIVGLLYRRLMRNPSARGPLNLVPDNWIYVQEPGVKVGRLQIFNNWSPYLVRDPDTIWIGLEYFCSEGDALWNTPDAEMKELAMREMQQLKLADPAERLDSVVIRMPKAYPAYFGSYARFDELRAWLDGHANLYLVGRNGMHRYNNQDHSMLSAKKAVEAILARSPDKSAIWAVNIDDDYLEESR